LRKAFEAGEIERIFGARTAQHVRQGLLATHAILLYKAHALRTAIEEYLLRRGAVRRIEAVGAYRRRVEVIDELAFFVETPDFPAIVRRLERYGGQTPLLQSTATTALFSLSAGVAVRIEADTSKGWGTAAIRSTGNKEHLEKPRAVTGDFILSNKPCL
jgi:DNA polymerase (family 10)